MPMDKRFQHYGETVCQFVSHATRKEKKAIQAELAAHMEDHALALLDSGYDQDHALATAVASMGDPEEVGKALNKEYPLLWLILSRGALVVIVLLVLSLGSFAREGFYGLRDTLQARIAPMDCPYLETESLTTLPPLAPVDLLHPIGEDSILSIFGIGLSAQEDGTYDAFVCAVNYPESIWGHSGLYANKLEFSSNERGYEHVLFFAGGSDKAMYAFYRIPELMFGNTLTAKYDHFGTAYTLDLPLPWEEVSQ